MKMKVSAWWCTNDPRNAGWYCEERDEDNNYVDDSQKVWFPVDLDAFARDEAQELIEALCEAFPDHEIYVEYN